MIEQPIVNYTLSKSPQYICELNALNMYNEIAKIPFKAFVLLLISFLIFSALLFFSKYMSDNIKSGLTFFSYGLFAIALFLLVFNTFDITYERWKDIEKLLYVIFGIIFVIIVINEWDRIRGFYKSLKESDE